jgi:hypothetical protein
MPANLSREVVTVLANAAAVGEVAARRAVDSTGMQAVTKFVREDTLLSVFLAAGIGLLAGRAIAGRRIKGYPTSSARLSNLATRAIK